VQLRQRVKCVTDKNGYALYFSRGMLPHNKDGVVKPFPAPFQVIDAIDPRSSTSMLACIFGCLTLCELHLHACMHFWIVCFMCFAALLSRC